MLLLPVGQTLAIDPATVTAAAAAATVVLTAVDGLSKWIGGMDDNCAAAALGASWGADCVPVLSKTECQRTGFYSAECKKDSTLNDTSCAKGSGWARAEEGTFGAWAHMKLDPHALARRWALHLPGDVHGGRGWGKANVDGNMQAKTEESFAPATDSTGMVFVDVTVDSIYLRTVASTSNSVASETLSVELNGSVIFESIVTMDGFGNVQAEGDIPSSAFTQTFDGFYNTYNLSLVNYTFRHPVGVVPPGDSIQVHLSGESIGDAYDADAAPPTVTERASWGSVKQMFR
jgi:hypothetical protein